MRMENVEVSQHDGMVCVDQIDHEGNAQTIRLCPEQCLLLAQWITEAAKAPTGSGGESAKA